MCTARRVRLEIVSIHSTTVFELRQKYIPRYYHVNHNKDKMDGMLSLCNVKLLSNIAVFVNQLKLF
jgi:hypothetical protein